MHMHTHTHWLVLAVAGLVLLAACGDGSHSELKAADSQSPTAGICAEPSVGDVATVTINVDTPSPRCLKVIAGQRLRVDNSTSETARIELGRFNVTIGPGGQRVLDAPVETYLAPGVHVMKISSLAGGAEVWLTSEPGG